MAWNKMVTQNMLRMCVRIQIVKRNWDCCRFEQMPETDPITDFIRHVSTYFWVTIWYKYHGLIEPGSIAIFSLSDCVTTLKFKLSIFRFVNFLFIHIYICRYKFYFAKKNGIYWKITPLKMLIVFILLIY